MREQWNIEGAAVTILFVQSRVHSFKIRFPVTNAPFFLKTCFIHFINAFISSQRFLDASFPTKIEISIWEGSLLFRP